jgi:SAM-dependent methyltransferase
MTGAFDTHEGKPIRENMQTRTKSKKENDLLSQANELAKDFNYINSNWDIQNNSYSISSHRPIIGNALTKGRDLVNGEIKRYVDRVILRQKEFNASVVRILNETMRKLEHQEKKSIFSPPIWSIPEWEESAPLNPPAYWAGLSGQAQDPDSDKKIQAALGMLEKVAESEADRIKNLSLEELHARILADTAPLPVPWDRETYFGDFHLAYWLMGLGDFLLISEIADDAGIPLRSGTRFLDFGCASGRVLRQFIFQAEEVDAYGCDMGQNNIRWIRKHLPPRVGVFLNTILPYLPIPDGFIDFVYAGSVFTHIGDFEEAWLLELRRILRPNGIAFLTVSTDHTWPLLADPKHFLTRYLVDYPHRCEELPNIAITDSFFQSPMPEERITLVNTDMAIGNINTFHSEAYIRSHWSRFFDIEKVLHKMHGNHQDGILLRKRE